MGLSVVLAMSVIIAVIILFILFLSHDDSGEGRGRSTRRQRADDLAGRQAGKSGEKAAAKIIRGYLRPGDELLCGVNIENDGKTTDLDCVVVNQHGVFIFEVKNYVGELSGGVDDYEWLKIKETYPGQYYKKTARNPIKQVRREEYLTKEFLKYYGFNVWVDGYAYMINHNSPVNDRQMIECENDIDRIIHPSKRIQLSAAQVKEIVALFRENRSV